MAPDTVGEVAALLSLAEIAHGDYEATELHGVYDDAWATWYADYLVQHGIDDLLGQPVTSEWLAKVLATAFAEFQAAEPPPADSWADHIARRIVAGPSSPGLDRPL